MTETVQNLPLAWTCTCRVPPLVLARFNLKGAVALEHHERFWLVNDRLTTNCPGCGKQHRLELELDPETRERLPEAWQPAN